VPCSIWQWAGSQWTTSHQHVVVQCQACHEQCIDCEESNVGFAVRYPSYG
jgi:hypothetical protein